MLPTEYRPHRPPFDHQREALEMSWDREGFAYLMEMGTGKTRTAIDNACLLYTLGKIEGIVICAPKSVYTNWTRASHPRLGVPPGELETWLWPEVAAQTTTLSWRSGTPARDNAGQRALLDTRTPGLRILAFNSEALISAAGCHELVTKFLRAHRTLFIVDESTLMKNPESKISRALIKLAPLASYRRIATGSPITRSPVDLFPQFEFLLPGRSPLGQRSIHTFRARYCVLRDMTVGARTVKIEVGQQNMTELSEKVKVHSFRKLKDECLDLPPKIYMSTEVEMMPEQKRIYQELKQTAMAELSGSTVSTQIVITQMMRLHQVACGHVKTDDGRVLLLENRRMQAVITAIEEIGSEQSVIIWSRHRDSIGVIRRALEAEYGEGCCAEWHGGVPLPQREQGEADFQAGRRRFMLATQQSGAKGRTWTRGSYVIYYSNDHDLELRQQSEDRAHRIGQRRAVTYLDIVCRGTVDEGIIRALRQKLDLVQTVLMDGPKDWI